MGSFLWAVLHEPKQFVAGRFLCYVHYPLLPWLGIMMLGYWFGNFYRFDYDETKRKRLLLNIGIIAIAFFILLRSGNFYGEASHWTLQRDTGLTVVSFFNTTKYPPSLLYILMTLGPAFIFLAFAENKLTLFAEKISIFGRVAMFYYLTHILLIHFFATIAALLQGFYFKDMVLSTSVMSSTSLKGYGFNLVTVYMIWISLLLFLYPLCKWYDQYKRKQLAAKWWLSYL